MHSLNDKLPTKGVKYLPEEESEFHYLMKRIVCHYLKENGYTNIETEVLIEREEARLNPSV
jgi:hypothetical protein